MPIGPGVAAWITSMSFVSHQRRSWSTGGMKSGNSA